MSDIVTVTATDGAQLQLESLATTYAYNADGTLASQTVSFNGHIYTQILTYSNSLLVAKSAWTPSS